MYSLAQLNSAKEWICRTILDKPCQPAEQVKGVFIRPLLDLMIERSEVTQDDVQAAIVTSIEFMRTFNDLGMYTADEIIEKLQNTGDKLVGTLSRKQVAQLRKMRNLCLSYAKGNRALLSDISRLLFADPHKVNARV